MGLDMDMIVLSANVEVKTWDDWFDMDELGTPIKRWRGRWDIHNWLVKHTDGLSEDGFYLSELTRDTVELLKYELEESYPISGVGAFADYYIENYNTQEFDLMDELISSIKRGYRVFYYADW